MKVLMFGWEFPPHISGGLGTACFGLTQALLENDVNILFVVPRLHGDEGGTEITLISASDIRIKKTGSQRPQSPSGVAAIRKDSSAQSKSKKRRSVSMKGKDANMTYIEAAAALTAYESLAADAHHHGQSSLTAWNYSFSLNGSSEQTPISESTSEPKAGEESQGDRYIFSGTYGANLLEEVRHYGAVGDMLGKTYSFDIIHVHDWMAFPAGIGAKRTSKKPLIAHVHSTEFDRSGERINKKIFEIEKRGLMEADSIIAVSKWTKDILISRYGIAENKIRVIHNGIVPREQAPAFSFPDLASHFITFLGRVTHQKGPRFFVEAAQKVLQEFPDAHFIVAGAGDLLPHMIERVAQLNMSANFHFTGFLSGDRVDQVWSLTDVYVMPSVSEPFGLAPLEAIQGGVPVILSNQSGVSEVMPHAIKVDFWDVKALAGAICSVLRYESLSQVLRQNSRQHIQHLTWDKAARNVNTLYHELTGNQ